MLNGHHLKTKSDEKAFTLLELVIALSIATTLILIVSLSIRMGIIHMEKGNSRLDDKYRESSAFQFMSHQISSIRNESNSKDVIFSGNSDRIMFVTPLSLEKRYGLGLISAVYYNETDENGIKLNYKEKRFIPDEDTSKFKDPSNGMFQNVDEVMVFEGCDDIIFQFLEAFENKNDNVDVPISANQKWKDTWIENKLPTAIKVTMSKNGQVREIIAPIMVMY